VVPVSQPQRLQTFMISDTASSKMLLVYIEQCRTVSRFNKITVLNPCKTFYNACGNLIEWRFGLCYFSVFPSSHLQPT